jgi:hypothetical protein
MREPSYEPYADTVNRTLASIAEGIIDEGIIYDCPWDDFRFNYFRGKDSDTAPTSSAPGRATAAA